MMKACIALNNMGLGKLVYDAIRLMCCELDVFVESSLV